MKKGIFQVGKVVLVSFSHFVHDVYTSFLPILLPLIIEKFSLVLSQAGLLSTIVQAPALLSPFIGLIADNKRVSRWLLILTPTLTAIPMSFILNVSSYGLLVILVFFTGISIGFYHVPSVAMVAKYSGNRQGRGMSMFMTGGEAARTIGPIIGVAAIFFLGEDLFYTVLGFAVLTSVMLYFTLEKEEEGTESKKRGSLKDSYKEIRHVFNPLTGIIMVRSLMYASMNVFLVVLVERQTGSLWLGGTALAVYQALGVMGILSSGILSDLLGRKRVLFWILLFAPFAFLFFIMTTGVLKIIMLFITGFTVLSDTPVMLAIIQENAEKNPLTANGLFMMVMFSARAFAVVIAGVIGDFAGLESMFVISALIGFAALLFLLKLKD